MRKKLMMLFAAAAAAFGAWAATLSNTTAKQRYPWNGKVDITYTLTGNVTAGLPAWNMPFLSVTASNRVDGATYAADDEYGTKAARLLAKVQAAGVKTFIDIVSEQSDRFARVVRPALRYCDYAIINEIEGSLATGVDKSDLRGICEGLFGLGVKERVTVHCPEVGVTLGKAGDWTSVLSLKLPDGWIRGSVGAGDAFCAGMLYALLKDMPPEEALRLASCAAACNLAAPDSISGAKPLAETIALDARFQRG